MCGIFGFVNHQNALNSKQQLVFDKLMKAAYLRGKEVSGAAALIDKPHIHFIKSDINGREMVKAPEYANFKHSLHGKSVHAMIGHSRLATHGSPLVHEENKNCCEVLQGFFYMLGLDSDEVPEVVDNIKKLY